MAAGLCGTSTADARAARGLLDVPLPSLGDEDGDLSLASELMLFSTLEVMDWLFRDLCRFVVPWLGSVDMPNEL